MPELPEVETARAGLAPLLTGRMLRGAEIREPRLRWPVPTQLPKLLHGRRVEAVTRRGKYLLLSTDAGTLLIHLGMSGSLRMVRDDTAPSKHDHVDVMLSGGHILRFRDPRRFGSIHWHEGPVAEHFLLAHLGPEPLDDGFGGDRLYARSRGRRAAVKSFVMDARTVVGVGNIYASEALFLAGIHPARPAGRISMARYTALAASIRRVLTEAIAAGGTTLKDFVDTHGQPGYFARRLRVYGRKGEPCTQCGGPIRSRAIGQRTSYYCGRCQH